MSDPARLTSLDASFLHIERPETPMHVGALALFEGAPFFDATGAFRLDDLRRHIESRLVSIPRFRQHPRFVPLHQGRPVWADDPDFDISRHVLHLELDPPGSREQLWALCEELHMVLLDRDHPLWELWFVTGVDGGRDRVAMIEKVHHSMVDGVAAVDLAAALLDLEREVSPTEPAPWTPRPEPSGAELLRDALWEQLSEPAELGRRFRAALRLPGEVFARAGELVDALGSLASSRALAPSCSLNAPIGRRRRMHLVDRPLDEVKALGRALGGTVNDVVMAVVAGGLLALLQQRGDEVEGLELRALVPVSVRTADEHGNYGNRTAAFLVSLPLDTEDPLDRFEQARANMAEAKSHHMAEASDLLLGAADFVPPALLALAVRSINRQPLVNTIVTNVPGPPVPMYLMGAEMLDTVPVVPIGGGMVMTIAILSYHGRLTFGIHVDSDAVPDADVLTKAIEAGFDELAAVAAQRDRPIES